MTTPTHCWVLSGNDFPEAVFLDEADADFALAAHRAKEKERREAALSTSTCGQGNIHWHINRVPLDPQVKL